MRVLIVDDHAVVRQGIRTVLESEPDIELVGEASSAREAVTLAATQRPDIVLLDITMPGASGLDAVRPLLEAAPTARVLILSVHDNAEYVMQSVRAGAHGYVRKDTSPAELRQAVRAVHQGAGYFSPVVAGRLAAAIRSESAGHGGTAMARLDDLTAREREILAAVARGLRNKEIAARLGISVRTVEAHRENLARKTGLKTTADLTRLAVEHGLVRGTPTNA